MNKSAAGFCKRLYQSIAEQDGEEKAEEVCGKGVGAAATPRQKGRWAAKAMCRAQACLGEDGQARAMAGCACGPGPTQMDAARRLFRKCKSLEEYCEKRNAELKGSARFEARDGLVYISYPRCYCSMIKNAPEPIPRTWCHCGCEYTRRACSHAFESPVEVKLLKSSCAGDGECLFEVKIL